MTPSTKASTKHCKLIRWFSFEDLHVLFGKDFTLHCWCNPFSRLGTSTKSTLLLCWFVMDYHAHSGHCDVKGDGRKPEEIEMYVELNESQLKQDSIHVWMRERQVERCRWHRNGGTVKKTGGGAAGNRVEDPKIFTVTRRVRIRNEYIREKIQHGEAEMIWASVDEE